MNAQEYYHRVIDRLKNCFQQSHYVVATGNELVAEGYDPAFPAAAEPIDRLEPLTLQRALQVHIPLIGKRSQSVLMPIDFEIFLAQENHTRDFSDKDLDVLYAEAEAGVVHVADSIAPFNRAMFYFNDKFYFWVLKPVAKGYRYLVPTPIRTGVKNFFYNLITPVRMVNCVLQDKFYSAGTEFTRFVINSTVGMLGFVDPAQNYPMLKAKEEDLGQTFGNYGIGNGFYIVWPFLGPSTLRDTMGMAGDLFLNPVYYVRPAEAALGITAYEKVNTTSFYIGDYEAIKEASLDPYSAIRDAYIQHRKKKTKE